METSPFTLIGILNGGAGLLCVLLGLFAAKHLASFGMKLREHSIGRIIPFLPPAKFYTEKTCRLFLVGVGIWLMLAGILFVVFLPGLFDGNA